MKEVDATYKKNVLQLSVTKTKDSNHTNIYVVVFTAYLVPVLIKSGYGPTNYIQASTTTQQMPNSQQSVTQGQ